MKKKLLAALLTLSMLAATLGGCGSTPQEGSTTADTKAAAESTEAVNKESGRTDGNLSEGKIVFAYWGAESENNAIQAAVNDFRTAHPEIEVETQWIEADYLTKLQTQIAGETTADVYLISAGDLPGFAANFETQTVDVTKYLSENVVEALKIDGELKARPFIVKPKVMAINKDLFKECGVEIPAKDTPMTIDAFKEAIVALSSQETDPQRFGCESPWMGNLIYAFGGSYYKNNGTESNLDSKEDIAAANFVIDSRAAGYVPDSIQAQGQSMMDWFLSGRIAIYTDFGPWYIPQMEEVSFDWDLLPYFNNGGCKEVDGLAIAGASENKAAAQVFVEYMCENESAQKAIGGDSSAYGVPVNVDALPAFESIYPEKNMNAYVYAAYNQTPQETQKRTNEISSVMGRVDDETGVGTGTEKPEDVFPDIAAEINEILRQ